MGVIESVREIRGKASNEGRYYLGRKTTDAARLARAVRSHWQVENKLHWPMNVVFNKDQSRARCRYAAENLTLLRRWCLNLIKADKLKAKSSLKGRRKSAGWDNSYLLHLLGINLDAFALIWFMGLVALIWFGCYFTVTSIFFGFASSAFGSVMVNTPSV